ncbi:carbohydrate ABC transporter permease [Eremococcus coleocola]|uniref:carbohydrate ABC transporter permease n=1 Tax=Eremococcus coleocola TaxID=88132 RepID=UPI000403A677|nr:sugar ABC transporter permease [Eremococcus coleocola]
MKKTHSGVGYLLLVPLLLVQTCFVFYPLLYTIYLSFFKWNMVSPNKKFVGFDNYIKVLTDNNFQKILVNTFIYILIFVICSCILPYVFAFIMDVVIVRFKKLYTGIFFIPAVISLVVVAMVYTWILNPVSGPLAIVLRHFGLTMPMWTNKEGFVVVVISLITSWKVFGYNFIVLYAAIMGIDRELIDAAKIDNISNWKIFRKIVLPMSSSTGIYVFVLAIVQGLQYVFTPIKIITKGGPNYASSNLIYHAYQKSFEMFKVGEASAISVMTLIMFVILLLLTFKFIERKVYYEN